MIVRAGTVNNIYPGAGKVQVRYEDTDSTSLPLPMLTFNGEYSMPKIGDRVATLHFENGSSHGFCLGTFYGSDNIPKQTAGYSKKIDDSSSVTCSNGSLLIKAKDITFSTDAGTISLAEIISAVRRS